MTDATSSTKHFPATLVVFPEGCENRSAAFYLAAEEWLASLNSKLSSQNFLFTWQLKPTVVMGRNQVAENEVDITFCREHGIDIIRRKSGGGAIFADRNNIMISLVTEGGAVEPLFQEYSNVVAGMLTSFGAPATATGRNDIMLPTGKVCGNAFYHLANSNIVHGTMLYDTDYDLMMGALRPPVEKLKRHGVESVRQRVTLLKDYLSFGVEELRRKVESHLTSGALQLTADEIAEIKRLEQSYYEENF